MAALEAHTKHSLRLHSVLGELRQLSVFDEAVVGLGASRQVTPESFERFQHYKAGESEM